MGSPEGLKVLIVFQLNQNEKKSFLLFYIEIVFKGILNKIEDTFLYLKTCLQTQIIWFIQTKE